MESKKLTISCPERWQEEWDRSCEAEYKRQIHPEFGLRAIIGRLVGYLANPNIAEVRISKDWYEHCFAFGVYLADGTLYMNGGIIFHGLPDGGYEENGSVQLDRNYGWSTHT